MSVQNIHEKWYHIFSNYAQHGYTAAVHTRDFEEMRDDLAIALEEVALMEAVCEAAKQAHYKLKHHSAAYEAQRILATAIAALAAYRKESTEKVLSVPLVEQHTYATFAEAATTDAPDGAIVTVGVREYEVVRSKRDVTRDAIIVEPVSVWQRGEDSDLYALVAGSYAYAKVADSHAHAGVAGSHAYALASNSYAYAETVNSHAYAWAEDSHAYAEADGSYSYAKVADSHAHANAVGSHSYADAANSYAYAEAYNSCAHALVASSHAYAFVADSVACAEAASSHAYAEAADAIANAEVADSNAYAWAAGSYANAKVTGSIAHAEAANSYAYSQANGAYAYNYTEG
jgi:hypothetical protein